MNFASYDFWKILILCFVASRFLLAACRTFRPAAEHIVTKLCLLATALLLLYSESPLTIGAFLWVVLLGWMAVVLQGVSWKHSVKTAAFIGLLIAQLAPLFYFKYWNFALNEVLGLDVRIPSVLIPMGLSFYTFQTIGFWIDNLRKPQPRPTFLNFLNFCSFFPQIVAGPIEKRESLLPQIENVQFRIVRENLDSALKWIILGLAYKLVVADNLGTVADGFAIQSANAWHIWIECLTFGLRIYFDFAGYSFIAVGLGLLFGIHLTLNFRSPYWSRDLREFWRNWHVSLGTWLRDYIYLPLGGRNVRWWMVNTLIVFLVSGIWHGAGWGFLIWGLLHGIGVVACGFARKPILKFFPLQWAATLIYVMFTWLFFFERNPQRLLEKATAIFNPSAYHPGDLSTLPQALGGPAPALVLALITILAGVALLLEGLNIRRKHEPYQILRHPAASITMVFLIILLAPMEESSFIYFNF